MQEGPHLLVAVSVVAQADELVQDPREALQEALHACVRDPKAGGEPRMDPAALLYTGPLADSCQLPQCLRVHHQGVSHNV